MPTSQANPIARMVAVVVLATAFVVVIVVIASSGGSGDGGAGTVATKSDEPSKAAREALREGEYEVKRGDTLVSISDDTGIPIEVLTQLNPDLDPQALTEGTRIKLR